MTEDTADGIRERIQRTSEDALGKVAQELLENPLVSGAISRAFEAREKAGQAQEVAMGALNLPSAADLERLTRRVRSVAQRLEGIEDGVDRLDEKIARQAQAAVAESLQSIEERLAALDEAVRGVLTALGSGPGPGAAKRPAAKKPATRKPAAKKPATRKPQAS
jgi:hypothetical protein